MNYLRFSLQSGKNYMKFEKCEGGVKTYHDPDTTQFRLKGCTLVNNRRLAGRIFAGITNKLVCAKVKFETIEVVENVEVGIHVKFNPRKCPWWHLEGHSDNLDGLVCDVLLTSGRDICLQA